MRSPARSLGWVGRSVTATVLVGLIVGLMGALGVAGARPVAAQQEGRTINIELIFDSSGSMAQEIGGGETRMEAAKRVMGDLIDALPEREGVNVGFRIYGHVGSPADADRPESCQSSDLVVPIQGVNKEALRQQVNAAQPTGWTPIALSLERAGGDFPAANENVTNAIVLVTDGEETCGGDPAAALRSLAAQGIDIRVNIVGFAVADEALKAQFREWAYLGNGQYFDAAGSEDLGGAIAAAVQPPFRVLDDTGQEVAGGLVDGDPVEVPAGTYDVEVQSAELQTIEDIVVEPGDRVEVEWDDR